VIDLALFRILNRDVAFLVGVNFGKQISCSLCLLLFYIVLVNLEFVLKRSLVVVLAKNTCKGLLDSVVNFRIGFNQVLQF
jgi:hypothetical protein